MTGMCAALLDAANASAARAQAILVHAGAKLNTVEIPEMMCEMAARGEVEGLRTLIRNGVKPNVQNSMGRTALH